MVIWDIQLRLTHPTLKANITFDHPIVAIMGPSGSGKTSLARCLVGLLRAESSRIAIGDTILEDTERGILIPPDQRGIGYVPQNDLLMPHLSVRDNLTLSPHSMEGGGGVTLEQAIEALELGPLLSRRPSVLSGGERRRVAMGRALLSARRALVLDEPLTGLDDRLRNEVLRYLQRLLHDFPRPTLLITHRADEATALATHGALMEGGVVHETGGIPHVLNNFPGSTDGTMSIMEGTVIATPGSCERDTTTISVGVTHWVATSSIIFREGSTVRIFLDADDVILATSRPTGVSARNVLSVRVVGLELIGGAAIVHLSPDDPQCVFKARITAQSAARFALKIGDEVFALVKSHALRIR